MNLNKLPFELVEHTFNYLYGICDHCFDVVFAEDLQKNVVINKYRHVFDDNYYLPKESVYFKMICNKCLKKYFIDSNKFIYALLNHDKCENNQKCFCKLHYV
jgi:hypothetical protein